jgi:tRNA(fMet)-specific endonuclease VapC
VGVVLDTSAVVAMERAGGNLADILGSLDEEAVALPAIVLAELLVGVRLGSKRRIDERKAKIARLREMTRLIEFNAEIAQRWAELFVVLEKRGKRIPTNDLAVAATAAHLGYDILVGPQDEGHLQAVPSLRVVSWQPR